MTKDGRPSLINDIRLFAGHHYSYLKGQEEAVAYGRRIAWFLNGEGLSLGCFPALYINFTSTLEAGTSRLSDKAGEWWHRHVDVGVPNAFPNLANAYDLAIQGVVDALLTIRPDCAEMIYHADAMAREHRDQLRFLLKRKETAKLLVEISSNIALWREPCYLYISHTDKATGAYREADPIALSWHWEAFDLLPGIRLQDAKNLKEIPQRPAMSGLVKRRG